MKYFLLRTRQALFSPIQKIQLHMQPKILKGEHALCTDPQKLDQESNEWRSVFL